MPYTGQVLPMVVKFTFFRWIRWLAFDKVKYLELLFGYLDLGRYQGTFEFPQLIGSFFRPTIGNNPGMGCWAGWRPASWSGRSLRIVIS